MKLSELLAQQPHLDLEVTPQPGSIITDAVLLLRDVDPADQTDCLGFWSAEGTMGIVQYGLVCAAKLRLEQLMVAGPDPE